MNLEVPAVPELLTPATRLSALARSHPDRVSIVDGERRLTAAEVFDRAGRTAAMIIDRDPDGVAPIAVIAADKRHQILGALGVLLAGRGFSIIEVSTPVARAHEMVARLGSTQVLVADPALRELVPDTCTPIPAGAAPAGGLLPSLPSPRPSAPGCVVFTSGSTGRPKAVLYRFDTFEARVAQRERELVDVGHQVLPATSPMAFAAGVVSIYELLLGETIDLFDPAGAGPRSFLDWIDDRGFEGVKMVPSLVRSLEPHLAGRRLERLRSIRTVGEGLHWSDVALMRRLGASDLTVEAYYGSTEAGNALRNLIGPGVGLGQGPVPLGEVIPGREIRLEPIGPEPDAPVELVVVGGAIADGYLDDPELTGQRFVTTDDGRRAYRTGDLLTRGVDGELYHRGRVDDLVKIRGLLVEPAEPERVLRTVPGLAAATVLAQPGSGGAPRLVAHLATTTTDPATPAAVRRALVQQLPPHLVPSVLVHHDALPVTDRGKVDRDRLRRAPVAPWRDRPLVAPRGEAEELIAAAVAGVLEHDEVSRDDDIFELGADSLSIQELLVAIEDRTGSPLTVKEVIEAPTVAGLAERIGERRSDEGAVAPGDAALFNAGGTLPLIVAVAGAGGTAVGFRALAQALGPDQPVLALQQHGMARGGRPDRTVEAAAARAEAVLADRGSTGPLRVVGHSVGGLVAFELARRWSAADRPVELLVVLDAGPGADVSRLTDAGDVAERVAASGLRAPVATTTWLARGLVRRLARCRQLVRAGRRPARHRRDYDDFFEVGVRAARRYRPRPLEADVRLLLVHPVGSPVVGLWDGLAPVDHLEVGGDHLTMHQPPHVGAVASAILERLGVDR